MWADHYPYHNHYNDPDYYHNNTNNHNHNTDNHHNNCTTYNNTIPLPGYPGLFSVTSEFCEVH